MSDEADERDNVVIRHLEKLRGDVKAGFDEMRTYVDERFVKVDGHLADLRGLVLDTRAQMATHADVEALGRRLDVEAHATSERFAALEARVAELEKRRPS